MRATPLHTTPPQLARRYGVSPDKVVAWIRSGQLRAVNVASTLSGRPRWRIAEADIVAFELRRSATPAPKTTRRRRRTSPGITEYF